MKRHLYMFEGIVARFGVITTDGRSLVLPGQMRASRMIRSRELPVPLIRIAGASEEESVFPPVPVGHVCALHEAETGESMRASGILDLNEMDEQARETLLAGGQVPAAAYFDELVVEPAKGDPYPDVMYLTDWRVSGVATGSLYKPAWQPPTYIKLQTGHYADLSKIAGLD